MNELALRMNTDTGASGVSTKSSKRNSFEKLLSIELRNIVRNKWILVYFILFLALGEGLFRLSAVPEKVFVSMMSVMIIVVPLVSILFSTVQYYNNREFVQLLLSLPLSRNTVYFSSLLATMLPLAMCFCLGAGIPLLIHSLDNVEFLRRAALLIANGFLLTCSFSAVAFLLASKLEDRTRGFAAVLVFWFFTAVIYDGIFLFLLYLLSDYPTEGFALVMSFLNPIDLSRITLSLLLDKSALMGYTGAVYKKFFGSSEGMILSFVALTFWAAVPALLGRRVFLRKDF